MQKFAVDLLLLISQFLLGLAAGYQEYEEAYDRLHKFGFFFLSTETVNRQLADIAEMSVGAMKQLAQLTLSQLTNFNVLQLPNPRMPLGTAPMRANRLLAMLKNATATDALVVVQATFHDAVFLVTKREPLLRCDPRTLAGHCSPTT